jgi:uncharacterized protein
MSWAVLVVAVVTAAVSYALRSSLAGSWAMWAGIGVPYVALAVLAFIRLHRKQLISKLVRFRPGDPSLGIVLGLVLLGVAWLFTKALLPAGAVERAWLFRVFLLVGDPPHVGVTLTLLALVCCEELVWRGWIQSELRERIGARRAWMAAAGLYAVAHLPTLVTLQDPAAGKNPLVFLAALGGGLCWGFLAERTGRLMPGLFAHAVFSYLATQSFWLFV